MQRIGSTDIKYLKGVGDARARKLKTELGIATFRDLMYYFPNRYIDRSRFYNIAEFTGDMPAVQVRGKFVSFNEAGEGARLRLVGSFYDGRSFAEVIWFRSIKNIKRSLVKGKEYVIFGKPTLFNGVWSFAHPEIESYNPENPPQGQRGVYPLTEKSRNGGITSRTLQTLAANLFEKVTQIGDTLPQEIVSRLRLMPLLQALRAMHFPTSPSELERARKRLKFEELFYVELHILRYSLHRDITTRGHVCARVGRFFNEFYSRVLPFELTGAQKRVIREIRNDMRTGRQMNRLLQGDVGSGKTMVAFMSMLIAADNGLQSVLMAPTEILARQHYETLRAWGDRIGLPVRLLTGSIRTSERREIHAGLLDGTIGILIGTHAVIEDTVQFLNLGLVIIDEQHRFGVAQRARLWTKNAVPPHILVMTATPIPRTLAMIVYGDLESSVIDELPPGRKPIATSLHYEEGREQVYRDIYTELRKGRQVYIVYPLINENDRLELRSVEEGYKNICEIFSEFRVCCVHGRLRPDEKEHQMQLFVSGEARIMVATTVIEVGVNVPNASVMVIENAERFGLSQLHQLRGRVGRGADKSYCILMSKQNIGKETRERLSIMTQTNDGFRIAEADMKLRGPGDMEGTLQSGFAFNLKVASLASDGDAIQLARSVATQVLDSNPTLSGAAGAGAGAADGSAQLTPYSLKLLETELTHRFGRQVDWSRIS